MGSWDSSRAPTLGSHLSVKTTRDRGQGWASLPQSPAAAERPPHTRNSYGHPITVYSSPISDLITHKATPNRPPSGT